MLSHQNNAYRYRGLCCVPPSQVIKTPAYTVFREGNNIPNIGLGDFHHPTQTSKFESNEDTREGEIPAFQYNLLDPFEFNSIFGGWEVMRCDMPEAAFPSKDYMFAVSNDAGITGSPPSVRPRPPPRRRALFFRLFGESTRWIPWIRGLPAGCATARLVKGFGFRNCESYHPSSAERSNAHTQL